MTIKLLIPVCLSAAMLTSCSLAPRYERPMAPVATEWPTSAGIGPVPALEAAGEPHVADIGWRSMFTSPKLLSLIEAALANNRDLRIATLNKWVEISGRKPVILLSFQSQEILKQIKCF